MNNLKEIKIEIIKKCPLNCLHCSTGANFSKEEIIEFSTIKNICNTAKSIGLKDISISGGEPLLHKDIVQIINYITKSGYNLTLYTTGSNSINLTDSITLPFIKELYNVGLKRTVFSIYGYEQKEHEYYTRTLYSFNHTITAIRYFIAVGIKCEFHFVPLKSNFRNIFEIYKLAKQIGIEKISLLRFVPQGRGELIKNEILDRNDNLELAKIINALRKDNSIQIRLGSPYNFLLIDKTTCMAAVDRCIINTNGNIYPCDAFKNIDFSEGQSNIYKEDFEKIWADSKYLNIVRTEKDNYSIICKKCCHFAKCGSGCFAQKCLVLSKLKNNIRDPLCLNY